MDKRIVKKSFSYFLIIILSVSLLFSSCFQQGGESSKKSTSPHYYEPMPTPPKFEIPEIKDFPTFDPIIVEDKTYFVTYAAYLVSNNNVGHQWGYGAKYNGEYIKSGSYITKDGYTQFYLTVYAAEIDEYNDYGSTSVYFDSLEVGEKQTQGVYVTVRENRGKYSGHTAKWYFVVTVERIS